MKPRLNTSLAVMPVHAGIQGCKGGLDPGVRRSDGRVAGDTDIFR